MDTFNIKIQEKEEGVRVNNWDTSNLKFKNKTILIDHLIGPDVTVLLLL